MPLQKLSTPTPKASFADEFDRFLRVTPRLWALSTIAASHVFDRFLVAFSSKLWRVIISLPPVACLVWHCLVWHSKRKDDW